MEKVHTGKVITRGPGALAIPLPKSLAKLFNAVKDGTVEYFVEGDMLVLKFPQADEDSPTPSPAEGNVF